MATPTKTIGYFIPEFPQQTHIFFWREMEALKSLGVNSKIISTRRANADKVKHAFAKTAPNTTFYLHPPSISFFIYMLCKPIWLIKGLRYIFNLDGTLTSKLKLLYFLPIASGLIHFCSKHGISHVHGHSCASVAHILALAHLSQSLTYSLTLHGSLETYGDNHKHKMRLASFVSTVTRPLQRDVINLTGLSHDRVPVISMGVDLDKFKNKDLKYDTEHDIVFISVARLASGKGHFYSLKALAELKKQNINFSYVIIGDGPDEEEIRKNVKELDLTEQVIFKGSLGEDEVLTELNKADALLLTSYGTFEAAPVCVMEAMASGIPTITSIIGGTADMIENNVDGFLVEQKNAEQIEAAMLKLSNNRELLITMSKAARAKAEKQFNYIAQAKKLYNSIEKYAESPDINSL